MKIWDEITTGLEKYTTIIGIDLGHGETSAAIPRAGGATIDLKFNLQSEIKIFTAVYLSNDNKTVKIGLEAIGENPENGKKYVTFKDNPERLRELYPNDTRTKEQILQSYFKAVVDALYECNGDYLKKEEKKNTIIFVGCPSGKEWLDKQEKYAEILSRAAGVRVIVMPESRAALIKTHKELGNFNVKEGIVVFDIGSSTFDATYIYGGKRDFSEYSQNIGASMIEENMLKLVLEKNNYSKEEIYDIVNFIGNLRMCKEEYYNDPQGRVNRAPMYDIRAKEPGEKAKSDYAKLDRELMEMAVKATPIKYADDTRGEIVKSSWEMACRDFLESVREDIGKSPLQMVILTGGASRMKVLQDICRSVFNEKRFDHDHNPSFAVSKGLAIAGQTDYDCALLRTKVKMEIFKKIVSDLKNLAEDAAPILGDKIYHISEVELTDWATPKDTDNQRTIDYVLGCIKKETKVFMKGNEAKTLWKLCFDKWLVTLRNNMIHIVNTEFKKYYPNAVMQMPEFSISNEDWSKVSDIMMDKIEGIDIYSVLNSIDVDGFFESTFKIISDILLTILTVPGEMIDNVAEFFDIHLDISKTIKKEKDALWVKEKNTPYDMEKRQRFAVEFSEKGEDHVVQIRTKIKEEFTRAFLSGEKGLTQALYDLLSKSIEDAIDIISLQFST